MRWTLSVEDMVAQCEIRGVGKELLSKIGGTCKIPAELMMTFHKTKHGEIVLGDSLDFLTSVDAGSVDLVITSPPFGLVRKKDYGNVESHEYVEWFKPFGKELKRILKPSGSLVIDIGGAWIPGQLTRSLYHFELAIMLCRELEFYLAREFFWWNPSKPLMPVLTNNAIPHWRNREQPHA